MRFCFASAHLSQVARPLLNQLFYGGNREYKTALFCHSYVIMPQNYCVFSKQVAVNAKKYVI